jgi:DegV family protein with EDD domain
MTVAVVTDSASDLTPDQAAANGITVVPLLVSFGDREYRAGVDLDAEAFWRELTREDGVFPKTAAAAPGTFQSTFERLFDEGADEIVYVGVGSKLSATIASAKVARDALPGRPIHIVDSNSACMGIGLLALEAVEMANSGKSGAEIADTLATRRDQVKLYVVLETLEYLKRGGRISPARAAIGGLLSVKPIITLEDGEVETADRPRTSGKARARLVELLAELKPERVAVLHGQAAGINEFADELAAAWDFPRSEMSVHLIGSSVGPHVGPGAYGAVVLQRPA